MKVSVRTLCDFVARSGDLDLRFTPVPSASQGIEGHQLVASTRPSHYLIEESLNISYQGLEVAGRVDAYDPRQHCVEEIKTFRGRVQQIKENQRALHQAQLKVYAYMLCVRDGLSEIEACLIYFNVDTKKEHPQRQRYRLCDLQLHFEQLCSTYLSWAQQEQAHQRGRSEKLKQLAFPFTEFRYGQRELAIAVYRNTKGGAQQLLEAPTGMGKTLGVLFPALKAISSEQKIFFLTAKNSGKRLATEALLRMDDDRKATGCRTLELASKQQLCKYPDKACHGDDCPLAKGFYDRLADARRSALEAGVIDEFALVKTAAEHDICPYYLSLALIRWSDVVVADYNHYFDFTAVLHAYTQAESWSPVVVVDEGHNLVDRARSMYSASLSTIQLLGARKAAPKKLKSVFSGLIRALTDQYDELASGTTVIDSIDADVGHALNDVCIKVGAFVADEALPQDSVLLRCYFDILYFQRLYELFGMHSMADVQRASNDTITLTIRNVVPAPFLEERLNDAHSVTIFSATLRPAEFYKDLLGLNEKSSVYGALSPFKSEQLTVRIATDVSTRYQDRKGSIAPICEQVIRTHAEHPGNYLFFLSSFEYVEQVRSYFMREHPQLTIWTQTPGMSHIDRNAFLRNFHASNTGIGLAVLGGVFSEGVDLPGDRLIGAFIATLGLPQINPINEAYKERVSQIFGPALAYDYTYLYPGIRKVVQAAGRVIRTENDKGTLYLLDNRYAESRLRGLLPSWWEPKTVRLR